MKKTIEAIAPVDKGIGNDVQAYLNTLTKPKGSLGRLESLAVQLGEITSHHFPVVSPPGIIVFAADHGIADEGVSAYPKEVTSQMVHNFLQGGAAINVLAEQIGAMLQIVDVGVCSPIDNGNLITKKIRYGTANFLYEDAMSKKEAVVAIEVGIEVATKLIQDGAKCILPGEMGIGNTTSSSAILAVLSQEDISTIVGSGTGISEEQRKHKVEIIQRAIKTRNPDQEDVLDILAKVGGLEIAGMTGAILGAASKKTPIIIDGFISTIAALVAVKLCKDVKDYLIIGHQSEERGHQIAVKMLECKPVLDLQLRLGEGTGAALAFPLLDASVKILQNMATFSSAGVTEKEK
ncbi:nicotinate-nucleotide--dimethylbenzimidazole phosphoribosyltransferase [Evansella vedderi]|uniref:Nicotinate-nucleotide--dimethylbenzimidazole phosphoribosyltransferase n=1 Tax=Evansella vedderi TaxID=38282 RepID=A0ABT9ZYN6_9BACI|nr:nicotinate-nucleotide--dimethylbenzimidazole phosphoribosyltransferase [Evansella vedderi]MDQ0256349.1 nicotinate-nucleotide--dimethylbenzimidazole phosphoribosyltransferase [Evansella vedderi]